MLSDAQGLSVTTDAPAAVEAVNQFAEQVLGHGNQAEVILQGLAADPTAVLVNAHGAVVHLWAEAPDSVARARPYLQTALAGLATATARERWYVRAIAAWVEGDFALALRYHSALAEWYPRDLIAASIGQYHYLFNQPSSAGMLRLVETIFPANRDNHYVHGMLAFALEQNGCLEEAEAVGRQAVAMNRHDPWAHHAVAHVFETQGRDGEGIAWMESVSDTWEQCGSFYCHNWWHLALYYLRQGDVAHVLDLYDQKIWGRAVKAYPHCHINAISLLIDLELAGVAVGDRWHQLEPYLFPGSDHPVHPLVELHQVYALTRAGHIDWVEAKLQSIGRHAASHPHQSVWERVVVPMTKGLVAFAKGDRKTAAVWLEPVLPRLYQVGGSHAQRAIFQRIYQAA